VVVARERYLSPVLGGHRLYRKEVFPDTVSWFSVSRIEFKELSDRDSRRTRYYLKR
jgi:N-acyl-L-homoserine lactone synthetase